MHASTRAPTQIASVASVCRDLGQKASFLSYSTGKGEGGEGGEGGGSCQAATRGSSKLSGMTGISMFRTFSHNVPDRPAPGLIVVAYQSRCLAHIHSHAHSSAHLRDKPLRRCSLLGQ